MQLGSRQIGDCPPDDQIAPGPLGVACIQIADAPTPEALADGVRAALWHGKARGVIVDATKLSVSAWQTLLQCFESPLVAVVRLGKVSAAQLRDMLLYARTGWRAGALECWSEQDDGKPCIDLAPVGMLPELAQATMQLLPKLRLVNTYRISFQQLPHMIGGLVQLDTDPYPSVFVGPAAFVIDQLARCVRLGGMPLRLDASGVVFLVGDDDAESVEAVSGILDTFPDAAVKLMGGVMDARRSGLEALAAGYPGRITLALSEYVPRTPPPPGSSQQPIPVFGSYSAEPSADPSDEEDADEPVPKTG